MLERWQHWLTPLFNEIPTLAVAALFFLLLALVVNRGNLRQTLARLLPRGLKVNLAVYALDILIVAGPLGYLLKQLSLFIAGHGFTIFDEASLASLPAPLLLLLTVFVGDGISYFRHRLEHSRLLWPAHVLHHSDDDMSWFTVFRFHPLNRLSTTVIDIGLLLALGIPGWAIAANLLIRHYYGMFIHAALPWTGHTARSAGCWSLPQCTAGTTCFTGAGSTAITPRCFRYSIRFSAATTCPAPAPSRWVSAT